MSSPVTGSFYGVVTFVVFGGAFFLLTGWSFPSTDRYQTSIMLTYFLGTGWFAMKVGKHRDVPYLQALGRAIKGMVLR